MLKKPFKYKYLIEEKGSTMIAALLILLVLSTLGMGLIGVTSSNFKQTGTERDYQSVYYIAEAGVNRVIHDISKEVHRLSDTELSHKDFFAQIDDYIIGLGQITFDEFEESFGQQPKTIVTITLDGERKKDENVTDYSKATKSYTINSTGQIGKRKRTVTTSIEISHGIEVEERAPRHPAFDYVMYGGGNRTLVVPSGTNIDGAIYGSDIKFNAYGATINGPIISETSVDLSGGMKINGDIYALDGAVKINSASTNVVGDIHSTGGVIFGSGAQVKNIYTLGNIQFSSNNIIDGDINAAGHVGNENAEKDTGTSVTVNGSIFSDGYVVTKANQNYKVLNNVYAKGQIINGAGNSISGDAISAQRVVNNGTIKGTIIQNGNPVSPPSPKPPSFDDIRIVEKPALNRELEQFQPSYQKTIISTGTHIFEPGEHGIVEFDTNQGGVLVLKSGGNYFFNSITGANQNKTLRLDFSNGGNINIYIKNNLKWNGTIEVTVDGRNWKEITKLAVSEQIKLAERVYWETHGSFEIHEGGDKQWLGTILSKGNAKIVGGHYIVGNIVTLTEMDYGGSSNYEGRIIFAAGQVGNESHDPGSPGDDNDEGVNIIKQSMRVTTKTPIREQ